MESTHKVSERDHYQMKKPPVNRIEGRKHLKPARYTCGSCDKKFRNPHAMRLHERDSHGIDIDMSG